MPAELAGVDGEAAEAVDEVVKRTVAGFVVAEKPGRGTLFVRFSRSVLGPRKGAGYGRGGTYIGVLDGP